MVVVVEGAVAVADLPVVERIGEVDAAVFAVVVLVVAVVLMAEVAAAAVGPAGKQWWSGRPARRMNQWC